jgi:hypothetical protein
MKANDNISFAFFGGQNIPTNGFYYKNLFFFKKNI